MCSLCSLQVRARFVDPHSKHCLLAVDPHLGMLHVWTQGQTVIFKHACNVSLPMFPISCRGDVGGMRLLVLGSLLSRVTYWVLCSELGSKSNCVTSASAWCGKVSERARIC